MASLHHTNCCGMKELYGIGGTPEGTLMGAFRAANGRDFASNPAAFYIFTGVVSPTSDSYGGRLAAYIEKNKLGTVISSEMRSNPNSGNWLKAWIWHVDSNRLEAWFRAKQAKAEAKKKEAK